MITFWRRRTLRFKITSAVTVAAVLVLLALARLVAGVIGPLMVQSVDSDIAVVATRARAQVTAGATTLPSSPDLRVRVLDIAGNPVDGQPPPRLSASEVGALKAGQWVLRTGDEPPHRWHGAVVSAPDGTQRLVVVGAGIPGYWSAQRLGARWLSVGAVLAGLLDGAVTWLAVRGALRPVQRMREAARASSAGQRLPVPAARDELRELAEEMNALLARRDHAIERLQRFTGDAAHELRSPIASIRAQAEVAVVHPDPELSAEVLADVVAEAERMSVMVSDLLVLARSDAGELPPVETVDLAFAVQAAINRLPGGGPLVRFEAPGTHCTVSAASAEVDLVLDNLLRNASRYARAGVTVTVLSGYNRVRLLVDDDGHGIPREHRGRVFDRFYRVADDRARQSGGSGLGLALVAELVRRRRGSVRAAVSPEGGARFDIRWPAARVAG